jgi:outer membrane protein OmpA-like peptidoglycan-associated protein
MTNRKVLGSCVLSLAVSFAVASTAFAQQSSTQTAGSAQTGPTSSALATQDGDTGLWVVPTAEVLPNKKWSLSFYRTNREDSQGPADVSNFPANFAIGLLNHAEVFGSWTLVTRIDRDTQPLFRPGASTSIGGGLLVDYPLDHSEWFGNARGDLRLGTKINLLSEADKAPFGAAVRVVVKLPVGNSTIGSSTGKADVSFQGVISKRTPFALLSVYGGPIIRGNPAGYQLTNGLQWGVGLGFPERYNLGFHVTAEIYGERYFNNTITAPAGLLGSDGSVIPTSTVVGSPLLSDVGLTWQAPNGFFIGASTLWDLSPKGDGGFEVRLGYHPGARGAERPAPPPPPPAPLGPNRTSGVGPTPAPAGAATGAPVAAPAPAGTNRPPTVRAMCDPCTVEVGKTSTVSADAQDPDGDPLTYRWSAPAGTFSSPTNRQTPWTAPMVVGPVVTTVTVDDGHGHQVSDSVTIQVIKPVVREIAFEDVYFEFDRSSLRPDAQKILDDAVLKMQADPTLQITIEGYTCNIGTAEYNLALGERRAKAVRDYLLGRGVSSDRLRVVSYGAERPKYDNSREETRRLNRRAALVVRLTGRD